MLNSIAAAFVADLYKPFRENKPDRHYLRVSHVVTIIAGIVQILVALAVRHKSESALSTALSVASLINGPILGVFLLGSAKRGGPRAALAGMTRRNRGRPHASVLPRMWRGRGTPSSGR